MLKEELIKILQEIDGNPIILLETEDGYVTVKNIQVEKMHQSNDVPDKYISDYSYELEKGYNTYFHDNYKMQIQQCVLLEKL